MGLCTEPGQVIEAFDAAFAAGDANAIADLYEEDASYYDISGPALVHRGKAAIRKAWLDMLRALEFLDFTMGPREEAVAGDYAFGHMTFRATARPRGSTDEPTIMEGRTTEILHRGADGGWRYHVDHASLPQPE